MPPETLAALIAAIPMPVIVIGRDARIAATNTPAGALFGTPLEGRHHISALRQPALLDAIEAGLERGEAAEAEYLATVARRETTYRARVAPLAAEGLEGVLVSFEDVTPMQEAVQMRRDFIANVSHELRTPLTALMGFIETLQGSARDDPDARARFLEIMEHEAGRMNRLVRDLLSLSRVESEARMRPTAPVDLAQVVESVVRMMRPAAEAAEVTLRFEQAGGVGTTIPGDADQLEQVVSNLVENAIKYGGQGGEVRVQLEPMPRDPVLRGPALRLIVEDEGEGIDPIHIPRLTERFYRVDNHRSRALGGTGLGLAIAKHIVNRHRGRMRIESEKGAGTRISLHFPASA
ncbi:two-component sensor histidine kinase [Rhodobacteraceae bacterium WD3A24]|nr:two-component sensor histidine kinase [Rhodobacteraceae bacterium WD3A24]